MIPIISIIIPCYNGEKYLRYTLDCLKGQTIHDWECVIVNDGSTDGSLSIIKEYSTKDSRYKLVDKKNEGPSVARNVAVAASTGKYILPLDADDLIDPTYCEKAISYLEKHPEAKLVYCNCEFFGEARGPFYLPEYDYSLLKWENMIFCSAVYRRDDFLNSSGYDPTMRMGYEDWDFWLSFLNEKDIVYKIPETLFFYRRHGISRDSVAIDNIKSLSVHIMHNHPEIYSREFDNLLYYRCLLNDYKRKYELIIHSKTFIVLQRVLSPFQWIRNRLTK